MRITIEDAYLQNYIGIARGIDDMPGDLIIRNSQFAPVSTAALPGQAQRAIELRGEGEKPGHRNLVYGYNRVQGDDFQLFFLGGSAPCTDIRSGIQGYACPMMPAPHTAPPSPAKSSRSTGRHH
jgi:hypothetical protein